MYVASDLKWKQHIDAIASKAASRLYFVKQLKRSGRPMRPVGFLHHSNTAGARVRVSGVALKSHGGTVQGAGVDSAESYSDNLRRRRRLCVVAYLGRPGHARVAARSADFKRSVLPESSCLHYLLPDKRDTSVTGRLRHAGTFEALTTRTVKFRNSFIPYSLSHFH